MSMLMGYKGLNETDEPKQIHLRHVDRAFSNEEEKVTVNPGEFIIGVETMPQGKYVRTWIGTEV